jgi:hypothetical protein
MGIIFEMKPASPKKLAAKNPPAAVVLRQLLTRIREAKFPADADKFKEQELRDAGLWGKYDKSADIHLCRPCPPSLNSGSLRNHPWEKLANLELPFSF